MSPYEMASWEHWNPADATAGRSASDFDSVIDDLRVANERLIIASLREQELAEQSQFQSARLNALLNSINEGVVVANPLGEIVLANPLARTTLGFSDRRPLTLQQDWARIEMRSLDQTMLAMSENPLVRALRGERFSEYEILALVPIVGERRLSFTSGVVKDEIGDVVQAILLFRDVTELRKLEQQREESLSLISHDLRTPLTVIMGRAEMLSALTSCDDNGSLSNEIDSILRSADECGKFWTNSSRPPDSNLVTRTCARSQSTCFPSSSASSAMFCRPVTERAYTSTLRQVFPR